MQASTQRKGRKGGREGGRERWERGREERKEEGGEKGGRQTDRQSGKTRKEESTERLIFFKDLFNILIMWICACISANAHRGQKKRGVSPKPLNTCAGNRT